MCPRGHALFPKQATPSVNSTLQWTDATLLQDFKRTNAAGSLVNLLSQNEPLVYPFAAQPNTLAMF